MSSRESTLPPDREPGGPGDPPARNAASTSDAWTALRRLNRRFRQRMRAELDGRDIDLARYDVLVAIAEDGARTPTAVAERLSVSRASVAPILRELERREFVEIAAPGEDGARQLALTRRGQRLVRTLRAARETILEETVAASDVEERRALAAFLEPPPQAS